jgi:peptide/nickel transport system permease protein
MTAYLVRRLLASAVSLVGVALIVFTLVRLLPGDPARVIAGLLATPEDVERMRHSLGLDQPWFIQLQVFFARLLHGDLGTSARTRAPVAREIAEHLPATIELALAAASLATVIGVTAGVLAAIRRYSFLDYLMSVGTLLGVSMPVYWLGLMLIIAFAVTLHLLPASGNESPKSLILPAVTLASFSMALTMRITRSSMLEVLGSDYVRVAWTKGLRQATIVVRHALRNALIPILTVVALQFGNLLGGAVVTETVFGWPGMGQLLINSIFARDYPVVQGDVLVFASLFILINLVTDVLYVYVDPRIRYA